MITKVGDVCEKLCGSLFNINNAVNDCCFYDTFALFNIRTDFFNECSDPACDFGESVLSCNAR